MKWLNDLKEISEIGNKTKEVKLKNHVLTLRPLTAEEEIDVYQISANFEQGLPYFNTLKRETVLRSIICINGEEIPETIELDKEKLKRYLWLKKHTTKTWSQNIFDDIWLKCNELTEEIASELKQEDSPKEHE